MTDLNELTEFEKQLKYLIESRETFQPIYGPESRQKDIDYKTYMAVKEHGKSYMSVTRMAIKEHGQPYMYETSKQIQPTYNSSLSQSSAKHTGIVTTIVSHMAVCEHGQPYKNKHSVSMRGMAIREHGQPYKNVYKNHDKPGEQNCNQS